MQDRAGPGRWIATAAALGAFCLVSYFFFDRPVADAVVAHLRPWRPFFIQLSHIPDAVAPAVAVVALGFIVLAAAGRDAIGPRGRAAAVCLGAYGVAITLKEQLKYVFGRLWPETWVANNPSWLKDGAYGFFPFHGGQGWASFPSGHMTAACVVAACLWTHLPRLRWLWTLAALLTAVGLLGANYHWLSDIAAGAGLGTACGVAACRLGGVEKA